MEEIEARAHDVVAAALRALSAGVRAEASRVVAASERRARRAELPEDAEAIHDLRVALRRLRSLLRPSRRIYGKEALRVIAGDLKRFSDATGALRDEEVLRETLSALDLPPKTRAAMDAWMRRRAPFERRLRARATLLFSTGGAALDAVLTALDEAIADERARDRAARAWAERAVADAEAGVLAIATASAAGTTSSGAELHALRIRYKRLRYTAELAAVVLGAGATSIAEGAARMQKRLGEVHDLDEARRRIRRARSLDERDRVAALRALGRARDRAVTRANAGLAAWLTTPRSL